MGIKILFQIEFNFNIFRQFLKNNIHLLISIILIVIVTNLTLAQKKTKQFEGIIKYSINYSGEVSSLNTTNLPLEEIRYYKNNLIRTECNTPMASIVNIFNYDELTISLLIDMGTQKLACNISSKEETQKTLDKMLPLKITYFDSTKVIAGYNCDKAEVMYYYKNKSNGNIDSLKSSIYFTTEINFLKSNWNTQFKDIYNVLLEYTIEKNGIINTYTAKEVKNKKIPDHTFKISSDYKMLTKDEFISLLGVGTGEE